MTVEQVASTGNEDVTTSALEDRDDPSVPEALVELSALDDRSIAHRS